MNADEFFKLSIEKAKSKFEKFGARVLIEKPDKFFHDFFEYGLWRTDFREKLSILVDHALDLNQTICDDWGKKSLPIFLALSSSYVTPSIIKALLEFGADVNSLNGDGQTPIMIAVTGRYPGELSKPSIVKALVKAGADLSVKDKKGRLVTDLADWKALSVLVEIGAPFNLKRTPALSTAIFGKDAKLAVRLLKSGLKTKLSEPQAKAHLAVLENIAQEDINLFRGGIKGNDEKAEKLIAKVIVDQDHILEAARARPICKEEDLPSILRLEEWPPQRPEPTGPVNVQAPPASAANFHFPPDLQSACVQMCEIESDKRSADKKRSAFSKFISTIEKTLTDIESTDWETQTGNFIKEPIQRVYKESKSSRISRANELLRYHKEVGFNTYYADQVHREWGIGKGPLIINIGMGFTNTFNEFVAIKTSIPTIGQVDLRIWSNDEDLLKDKKFISYAERIENGYIFTNNVHNRISLNDIGIFEASDIKTYLSIFKFMTFKGLWGGYEAEKIHYCALAYRVGPSLSDALQSIAETGDEHALGCLAHLDASSLASFMAETLCQPGRAKHVQAWFRRFPDTVVTGLLESSFGSDLKQRINAQQALRLLADNGSRQLIIDCGLKFGHEAQAMAIEFLGHDSRADFLPKKMPKLPAYFIASAHPAPALTSSGQALPPHAVETLARMMLASTCHLQTPALIKVMEVCDRESLADFALSAYDSWVKNSGRKDGIGFLHALGYMGDARTASILVKNYRNAPFYPATAAAIEVLGSLGTNTAISGLLTIMRFSRYEKAQAYAQEVLEDIADARGLTPVMLEDLAVPDLGLDSNSRMLLDFGPRKFVVTLDFMLDAVLMDEGGNVLKALPKALKTDNVLKAKTATAQWKEFRAALKVQAVDQKKRFEQAMLSRREWDGATFKEVVANHPLLSKMVRSLVWATVNDGVPATAFMVDADGRYVTADGEELHLENEARVVVPHPVHLEGAVETWLQIFAVKKLTQPFPQLARKWFLESPETENLISDKGGTKVPLGALRGLKAKGWEFEEGGAGMVWSVYKSVEGARASIDVEPGWSLSGFDDEDFGGDQTVKLDISASDPIVYSELVREFLSLPVATGNEP